MCGSGETSREVPDRWAGPRATPLRGPGGGGGESAG